MALAVQLFTNNAVTLLQAPITATDTSLTVMNGYGAQFPQPTGDGSDFFLVTLENQTATVREIIRVTGRVGDTFTFALAHRGQEGTTPLAWNASSGDDTLVDHRITAETMRLAMRLPVAKAQLPSDSSSKPSDGLQTIEIVDDAYTFTPHDTFTVLTTSQDYAANSTKVHVAGLRLKRGVDFFESGPSELTLNFVITQANMDDGSNVVVDYIVA